MEQPARVGGGACDAPVRGNPNPDESIAFRRTFDRALLRAELDHFREYGLEAQGHTVIEARARRRSPALEHAILEDRAQHRRAIEAGGDRAGSRRPSSAAGLDRPVLVQLDVPWTAASAIS